MADTISWIATVATIIAASMTAANLGSRVTGYGFCVFLVGSLSWLAAGLMTNQPALTWTNVVLTVLNIFGIWRWLGRQAGIEKGASVAASASAQEPEESLFPVSLLLKAPIEAGDGSIGTSVDAMAGCQSGRLRYVVASEGGVAGVGETLRKIPWRNARVDSDRLVVEMGAMDDFQQIEKDRWPAR
ncbi:PRC-barrel domain-containing protein [Sphingomonas daechungensis]|uniref:PRC-barrel domain containing protein n=1 Tax=Sphingomonas daechungensis TaxID=1176646 RepID=A0ABX6T4J9_9SPHN|nr:PRC-barrel domain-containing protein [Sphingomonas daechungensis]QNP42573.1 PRC-barrel domain containing protein [Sphingomonas daechungensis]